jgi:tetratricopeptide (TPR) repeat protein
MIGHYLDVFMERYHQRRGLSLLHKSRFKKAIYHFEKAILIRNSHVNFFYLSVSMIAINQHARAVKYLENIIDEHREDVLIATTLAECYLVLREWSKAEKLLDFLRTKFSENSTINFLSETVADPILREKYALGKEFFFRATELLEAKRYEESFQCMCEAIEQDSSNASYHFFTGCIALTARKEKCIVVMYLERAVNLAPHNENFKKQLQMVKRRS